MYEAIGIATSIAVDTSDNVYVGTSPFCRVYRIAPDGTQQLILHGVGRTNHTVAAMKFVGHTLYVATGPTGGIYRIANPESVDPDFTIIFAREDLRDSDNEKAEVGAESVFVNALAVATDGQLLAAASSPGQLLKLEPRTEGCFLSPIMQAPAQSRWGQLDLLAKMTRGQKITVESRSGNTALPDTTWSNWEPVSKEELIVMSPPALYSQYRIRLLGSTMNSPELSYFKLYYRPMNQAPLVRVEQPKPGLYWSGTKDIRWDAVDADGNELSYTVFTSRDNGVTWKQLLRPIQTSKPIVENKESAKESTKESTKDSAKTGQAKVKDEASDKDTEPDESITTGDPVAEKSEQMTAREAEEAHRNAVEKQKIDSEVREKSIPWDTRSTPDGSYRIKVVASDKYACPDSPKSAEAISDLFVVENTPPSDLAPR